MIVALTSSDYGSVQKRKIPVADMKFGVGAYDWCGSASTPVAYFARPSLCYFLIAASNGQAHTLKPSPCYSKRFYSNFCKL